MKTPRTWEGPAQAGPRRSLACVPGLAPGMVDDATETLSLQLCEQKASKSSLRAH